MDNTPHTPISQTQFEDVCNILSESGVGLIEACKSINISSSSFYKYIEIIGEIANRHYIRARGLYIEKRLLDRDALNAKCLADIKHCDPRRVNAIQSHYKELARQIEWELTKLMRSKYGDDLGVRDIPISMPPRIEVVMVDNRKVATDDA